MLVRRRARSSQGIPMSSVADVAFLLLVFFLATTVFDQEKGLSILLPRSGDTTPVPAANLLQLTVRADGVVEVRRGSSPRVQEMEAADVVPLWRIEARNNAALIAAVRTHPDAPYQHMIAVLDALRTAGATRISLQQVEAPR